MVLLALALSIPLLWMGGPDLSHDGMEHARWVKNFSTQFWDGEIYPRWLAQTNSGFGSPVFFFYAPVGSYGAAAFGPFTRGADPDGWRALGLAMSLALVLSGLAAYWWLRALVSPRAASFGAAVYLALPYHTAIDTYNRGAHAEVWAFIWPPLVLLMIEKLRQGSVRGLAGIGLFYGLLVLTHLPTTLCVSPFFLAYAFFSAPDQRWRGTAWTVAGMGLGVMLASVYLVPAMLTQGNVHMEVMVGGFYDYAAWFLRLPLPLGSYPARVWFATAAAALLAGIAYSLAAQTGQRRLAVVFGLAAAAALVLMTPLSTPVWMLVPPLRQLQFPTRFNTLLTLSAAALVALALNSAGSPLAVWRKRMIGCILGAGCLMTGVIAANVYSGWFTHPADQLEKLHAVVRTQREFDSFWPAQVTLKGHFNTGGDFERFAAQNPPRVARVAGNHGESAGTAKVTDWSPRRVSLLVQSGDGGVLALNHFWYPGWRLEIPTKGMVLATEASPEGFIRVRGLPAGSYRAELILGREPTERVGIALTLAGGFILALLGLFPGVLMRIEPPGGPPLAVEAQMRRREAGSQVV